MTAVAMYVLWGAPNEPGLYPNEKRYPDRFEALPNASILDAGLQYLRLTKGLTMLLFWCRIWAGGRRIREP